MCNIPPSDLLHTLSWWQIKSAIRGYNRQFRTHWEVARFSAFVLVSMFGDEEKKPHSAKELLKFSWEREADESDKPISEEDMEYLENLINEENSHINS